VLKIAFQQADALETNIPQIVKEMKKAKGAFRC